MRAVSDPFSFLVVSIAGWLNRHQQHVIEYLIEENRVLREQIGNRRMRFTDDQRRRLAAKAKELGRKLLAQVATIVTPETLMAWHRKLIAKKYNGSAFRTPGRRRTAEEVADLVVRMAKENSTWGYRRIQGALAKSRSFAGPQYNRHYSETERYRTHSRTQPENQLERVPKPALGTDRRQRFLYC